MQNMKKPEIIFYDFENVEISRISFYINGFILNQKKFGYKFSISRLTPSILASKSMEGDWRRFLFCKGIFEVRSGGNSFFFCIDRSDHSTNYMDEGFHLPLLRVVKYYFKINYNKEAIYSDPDLCDFREKILPAGPSFPIRIDNTLSFLLRIILSKRSFWATESAKDRLRNIARHPKIRTFRKKRRIKADIDVFFVMNYYDHNSQRERNDFIYEVMEELESHNHRKIVTGFVSLKKLPGKFERLTKKPYDMKTYLNNLARSKVAIYVRGPHNGISSKFGHLLALGKPIIGQSIVNNKEQLYCNDYFDEQFAHDTPKEISDHVKKLLNQPQKLALLGEANANTFDTRFTPEITTTNIIKALFLNT